MALWQRFFEKVLCCVVPGCGKCGEWFEFMSSEGMMKKGRVRKQRANENARVIRTTNQQFKVTRVWDSIVAKQVTSATSSGP